MRSSILVSASCMCMALIVASCENDTSQEATTPPPPTGGNVDLTLSRDDVDCTPEGLGDDESVSTVLAYYVVDGDLGAVCFGEDDQTLIEAWEVLAAIVPEDQLQDLAVFAGFESLEEGDDLTLAFVSAHDEDGNIFQMSVNVAESEANPDESRLTMIHEFSHIFTQRPSQLDRAEDPETCEIYWNGDGCFYDDSIMNLWIEDFWEDYLADVDLDEPPTVEDGEQRCSIDQSFFGEYAASTPEEDFAEAFSAYVLQLPPATPEQQEKYDWFESQPGLAEFRSLAIDAGFGPQENTFDVCG